MEVEYTLKGPDLNQIDYSMRLSKNEVRRLESNPHILKGRISQKNLKEVERIFQLKKGITDDDSEFEMHYHPSGQPWKRVTTIHATMSEEAYCSLIFSKKYEGKHDHGLITIILE